MLERTFEPSLPRKADEESSPVLHAHSPDSSQPHSFLCPITEAGGPACLCVLLLMLSKCHFGLFS